MLRDKTNSFAPLDNPGWIEGCENVVGIPKAHDTPNPASIAPDVQAVVERLNIRTVEYLPENWKVGLKCPECDGSAERQKCMWDRGGGCPRHNARYYEPSPYKIKPDKDCAEAADLITRLVSELAAMTAERDDALASVDANWVTHQRVIAAERNAAARDIQALATHIGPSRNLDGVTTGLEQAARIADVQALDWETEANCAREKNHGYDGQIFEGYERECRKLADAIRAAQPEPAVVVAMRVPEIAAVIEALKWYANPEIYARSAHEIAFDNLSYHALRALRATGVKMSKVPGVSDPTAK